MRYQDVMEDGDKKAVYLRTCPKKMAIEGFLWVYDLMIWRNKVDKLGLLPNAGGMLDQPARFNGMLDLLRLKMPEDPAENACPVITMFGRK